MSHEILIPFPGRNFAERSRLLETGSFGPKSTELAPFDRPSPVMPNPRLYFFFSPLSIFLGLFLARHLGRESLI